MASNRRSSSSIEATRFPDLDPFDILIVLGGPMETWQEKQHSWLVPEKQAIRKWVVDFDKPLLGICLGHQLLADALGGKVAPAPGRRGRRRPTSGLRLPARRARCFAGFGASKRAINWHGSEVKQLPSRAKLLASTEGCPITAFSVGSAALRAAVSRRGDDRARQGMGGNSGRRGSRDASSRTGWRAPCREGGGGGHARAARQCTALLRQLHGCRAPAPGPLARGREKPLGERDIASRSHRKSAR